MNFLGYLVHIGAGSLGIIAGFTALYSAKGALLHRRAGMVFVYAMLITATFGLGIAVVRGVAPAINVPAALLTSYLVITSLITVRPLAGASRRLDIGAMLVASAIAVTMLTMAIQAIVEGGRRAGFAFPFFMFGIAATLGAIGDIRVIRSGALRGAPRVARHLWRMSFALFIAALSFFIGQAKVIPEPLRIRPLLALPVLMVLVTMFYWLWRVRGRKMASSWQLRPMSAA